MDDDIVRIARGSGANAEQYGLWGKEAAKRYFEDKTPMTDTIQKIASANGLNPDEVSRVAEFANLEAYGHLLKNASDNKAFEFPLADVTKITRPAAEKRASLPSVFSTDYESPLDDSLSKVAGVDIFEAMGVPREQEKVASPTAAFALLERIEHVAQAERDKLSFNMEKSTEDAEEFYRQIKQEFLGGKAFPEIEKAVKEKAADSEKYRGRLLDLLGWVKRRLYDEGVLLDSGRTGDAPSSGEEKKAEPVERALITDMFESPGVPIQVVNGRHPLFATMDTLVRQFDEADKSRHNLIILEDKIRYVKNRVYKNQ